MNTFLPMINDILFLLHTNPCFGIWRTLGKHFLPPAGCGSIFPAKSFRDAWKSNSWLARGQVNLVKETKLCSAIHSPLKCWLCDMWSGNVVEKNWALSVDHCQLRHCISRCVSLICWTYFSDVMVLPRFRKLQWIRWAADNHSDHDLPWCKFGFGKHFEASSWSSHWAAHGWLLNKIYFPLFVIIWSRNGLLLLHRIREDDTSKQHFLFNCQTAHEAPTHWGFSPFQFAPNAEWP